MTEQYSISHRIKEAARYIAMKRASLWKKWERNDYFKSYSILERNWQGCIAEVYLREIYPRLILGQPLVIKGRSISECDYVYKDAGVELKCNRFKYHYKHFLKNVEEHAYKASLAETLICTGINGPPASATDFFIFGWIKMSDVEKCDIWTPETGPHIKSPAYAIPKKGLYPMKDFFSASDFKLSGFMEKL